MRVLSECSLLRIARLCHSERSEEISTPSLAQGGVPLPLDAQGGIKGGLERQAQNPFNPSEILLILVQHAIIIRVVPTSRRSWFKISAT